MTITIPGLRLINGLNVREHWRSRAARAKREKDVTMKSFTVASVQAGGCPRLPVHVVLTRIGKRKMDAGCGNNASLKNVRDAVAYMYGVDDGDESRITFRYEQEVGRQYGVRIEIQSRPPPPG